MMKLKQTKERKAGCYVLGPLIDQRGQCLDVRTLAPVRTLMPVPPVMHAGKPAPHARPPPQATAVPAHPPPYTTATLALPTPHTGVPTHVVVHLMPVDVHAGGDHPRPLHLARTWGLPSSAPASCAC